MLILSVRRSMLIGTARTEQLKVYVNGLESILDSGFGLSDEVVYHAFVRLLNQFKYSMMLADLFKLDGHYSLLEKLANFSHASFNSSDTVFDRQFSKT